MTPVPPAVALVAAGLLRAVSPASVLLATWSVALAVVVAFQKIDWSGPTAGGYVHRYASPLAFVSLPIGALLLARRWRRDPTWRRYAALTGWFGAASLAWLAPILAGFVLRPLTGVPWWRFVPLGLTERGLAVTEVAVVLALGWWAWQAGRRAPRTTAAAPRKPDDSATESRRLARSASVGAR